MGAVYRVRDRRLGRDAALKLMHAALLADPAARARFEREVELTARLEHPSIPPIYEAGTTSSGVPYMLMKVIEGRPLSKAIAEHHSRSGAGEPRVLLEALVRVGEALAYAHSRRIVHRDLKPDNVLVGRFGEVLVMDWGLARDLGSSEDEDARFRASLVPEPSATGAALTQAGSVLGTPGYMPPEQADGGGALDERADVFALGATLHCVLTGRGPVEGATAFNKLAATVQGHIARPRDVDPSISPELDAIAAAALRPDPEARTASVEDFVADLRRYLAGEEVSVHRYGAGERLRRWARRRPALLVGSAAGFALLAVAGLLGAAVLEARAVSERAAAERRLADERAGEARATRDRLAGALRALASAGDAAQRGAPPAEVQRLVEQGLAAAERDRALLWEAARVYQEARLFPQAEQVLRELIAAAGPDQPPLRELLLLHRVQLEGGSGENVIQRTEAIDRLLELATKHEPEGAFAHFARGVEAAARGEHASAIGALDRAIALNPAFALAYAIRGSEQVALGDGVAAARDLDRALELDPRLVIALQTRADLRLRRGDARGAAEDGTRAIEVRPRFADAWNTRGAARKRLGDLDRAREDFTKALALNPSLAAAAYNRAVVRDLQGDLPGALEDYDLALRLKPGHVYALHARGKLRAKAGDARGAFADLDEAVRLAPRDAELLSDRSALNLTVGRSREAAADASAAIEVDPNYAMAHSNLGASRLNLRDPQGALAAFDRALALAPKSAETLAHRAMAKVQLRDAAGALADVERALLLQPGLSKALALRAMLVLEGDPRRALADCDAALKADPRDPTALRVRSIARRKLGDWRGAAEDAGRYLELFPTDPNAPQLRRELEELRRRAAGG
ncbi:MAG: tetratricopeptide repeat protein [Planctomycetota bacterium]